MTALAAKSGLLDSEFLYAADSTPSGIMEHVVSVVSTGGPSGDRRDPVESRVPWLAVWAASTLGGYLLAYAVASSLIP